MSRRTVPSSRARQRGAATLVVVMILFIIIAMIAAYASRNMMFEQRIAANYYRSGVAAEAAEAGAEWTLAMLNGIAIDGNCQPNTGGANSFRQRYLSFGANRSITVQAGTPSTPSVNAACALTSQNTWSCQCPSGAPLTAPSGLGSVQGLQPVFDVTLEAGFTYGGTQPAPVAPVLPPNSTHQLALIPGLVRVLVNSCTGVTANQMATWGATSSFATGCSSTQMAAADAASLASGQVTVDLALVSALKSPPASPLVVLGNVDAGNPAALGLHNSASSTGGLLLQAGGSLSNTLAPSDSLPGASVTDALVTGDPTLSGDTGPQFFTRFFGLPEDNYRTQPAIRIIQSADCNSDCGPLLAQKIAAGAQMLWIRGPAIFATNVTLGSATNPIVLIVDGTLTLNAPAQIYGLVYASGDISWVNTNGLPALLDGTLIGQGNAVFGGSVNLVYDASVISIVNNQLGSFVRVPGSWWDQVVQ